MVPLGMLLPQLVVSKGFSSRTDFGFLGAGLYFSDNVYSSIKYTSLPIDSKSRLLLHSSHFSLLNQSHLCRILLNGKKSIYARGFSCTSAVIQSCSYGLTILPL